MRVVYYYLLHKLGFAETWQPWYDMSNVEPVEENDQYWNYPHCKPTMQLCATNQI